MKIIYKEDSSIEESIIDISAKPNDYQVARIMKLINNNEETILLAKKEKTFVVNKQDIYYIEGIDNLVFAYTQDNIYESKFKLYELEEVLPETFIRISKSTIVNLLVVKVIEPTFNKKLLLHLENNEKVVVNRNYVKDFKQKIKMR